MEKGLNDSDRPTHSHIPDLEMLLHIKIIHQVQCFLVSHWSITLWYLTISQWETRNALMPCFNWAKSWNQWTKCGMVTLMNQLDNFSEVKMRGPNQGLEPIPKMRFWDKSQSPKNHIMGRIPQNTSVVNPEQHLLSARIESQKQK